VKQLLTICCLIITVNSNAQNTAIPDANFEQALINLGYDSGPTNGSVPTANIDTITSLSVNLSNISSLIGIEDFIALSSLDCWDNQLATLNISQNLALTSLRCNNNLLTSINVSQNLGLNVLWCTGNQLTSLDVTQNIALTVLLCMSNQITSLDVSQNSNLIDLKCESNLLSSLDVTQNLNLVYLYCSNNPFVNMDISQNINLLELSCSNTSISSLNVSQNTVLNTLVCQLNPQLTDVDVRNGNNTNFTYFSTVISANLKCIYVDDKNGSYLSSWNKDATSYWVNDTIDCQNISSINEFEIENPFYIYPNPTTGIITIDLGETKSNLNLSLINTLGQVILTENYKTTDYINLDLDAPKGVYFLRLETSGEVITKKIIIE